VVGKTAVVEPPEPDPNNQPNLDPRGDDRYLRSVVEDSSEIMKFVDLDGTVRSRAWRSP
jgi:hypothetical protein